jgi:hypothetical protein
VELERIIWRTSKVFVFGNGYNIVLAIKPAASSSSVALEGAAEARRPAVGSHCTAGSADRAGATAG